MKKPSIDFDIIEYTYEDLMNIDKVIAKHRKLLNRAVGNHVLPHINYHHYEIVKLIEERQRIQSLIKVTPLMSLDPNSPTYKEFEEMLIASYLKAEDDFILNGTTPPHSERE